jgi:AcrR family transcriptional regulator
MRYEKGHKSETHKRIIDAASQRFREEGIESVGVAGLMADAGLTHGGFYSHFSSKEELVRDAVVAALDRTLEVLEHAAQGAGGLEAIFRAYLQPDHRDTPGQGCVFACLGAELARHPANTRAALAERLERFVAMIAKRLPFADPKDRQDCAFAIFGAMVGTLQLARTVSDSTLSDRVLNNGIIAAQSLAAHWSKEASIERNRQGRGRNRLPSHGQPPIVST